MKHWKGVWAKARHVSTTSDIISIMFVLQLFSAFTQKKTMYCDQCLKLVSTLSEHRITTTIQICTVYCRETRARITFCTMISSFTWHTGKSQSGLFRLTLVSFQWRQPILCYIRSAVCLNRELHPCKQQTWGEHYTATIFNHLTHDVKEDRLLPAD